MGLEAKYEETTAYLSRFGDGAPRDDGAITGVVGEVEFMHAPNERYRTFKAPGIDVSLTPRNGSESSIRFEIEGRRGTSRWATVTRLGGNVIAFNAGKTSHDGRHTEYTGRRAERAAARALSRTLTALSRAATRSQAA